MDAGQDLQSNANGKNPPDTSHVENVTQVNSDKQDISSSIISQFSQNIKHPLSLLLLQILVILTVSRIFGLLLTWIGQPSVVGEIIAGIVLGPSIVGYFFPEFSEFLF